MRLIRACVIAAVAALVIAVPSASAATISIKPKNRVILYGGKSTKIVGHLSASPNSGQKVELQQKPYPYTAAFKKKATKSTDANGNYSFTVKPDRNTRYRVMLVSDGTVSGERSVYVNGVTKWKLKFKKGSRTIRVSFNYTFSPQLDTSIFTGVPLRWYFKVSGQKAKRVRTSKTKRLAQGVIGGNLKYTYPNSVGKRKFTVSWCFRPNRNGDVGVGVPGKAFKKCA
jgi:hypothetical protein